MKVKTGFYFTSQLISRKIERGEFRKVADSRRDGAYVWTKN